LASRTASREGLIPHAQPGNGKPHLRVCHPINTRGTTWLRESDLVFLNRRPYAVLSWSEGEHGEVSAVFCELRRGLLKHDPGAGPVYRYEGEIRDPRG
jgi:hypothetical protein